MKYIGKKIYFDSKGYPLVWISGKDVKVHIHVWETVNGKKPKGYQLHHKDFDRANYSLCNLELLTQSDHFRIHAGWEKDSGEWVRKPCNGCNRILPLSEFYPRKDLPPSALCKVCHSKKTAERKNNPEWVKKNRVYQREWAREKRRRFKNETA